MWVLEKRGRVFDPQMDATCSASLESIRAKRPWCTGRLPALFGWLPSRALNPQGMVRVSCKEAGLSPIWRAPTKRTMGGALGAEPWKQDCG